MRFPDDDNHFHLHGGDSYQESHREAAMSFVENWRVAVDVGAHVGTWTLPLAARFEYVHAFEPIYANARCLSDNLSGIGNVTVHQCALGVCTGYVHLRRVKSDNSGTWAVSNDGGLGPIALQALDSFQLRDVDFLKVDAECSELAVLQGARDTIRRCRPVVCVELRDHATLRAAGFPIRYHTSEVFDLLHELGLRHVATTVADHVFAP